MNRNLLVAVLLLACAASAAPALAGTHRKIIRPVRLVPAASLQHSHRNATHVSGGTGGWTSYFAVLRIPPGSVLTGMSFQHFSSLGSADLVELARVRPGKSPAVQVIYSGPGGGSTPAWTRVTAALKTGARRKVDRGWQYFVAVSLQDDTVVVGDITVSWRDP